MVPHIYRNHRKLLKTFSELLEGYTKTSYATLYKERDRPMSKRVTKLLYTISSATPMDSDCCHLPSASAVSVCLAMLYLVGIFSRVSINRLLLSILLVVSCVVFFSFILDIKFVGRTSWGHTGGRSHRIFHPPSFCGACLNFSREKDSALPFPRRP